MASNAVEDGSKCPICFEIYKEPKALVCLHTFCEICIHEYVLKSQEKGLMCKGIECPLCRSVTPVEDNTSPETWAKTLRSNFALASLLEATINPESIKQDRKKCQPCLIRNTDVRASVFCTVCKEMMCDKCKKVHDSLQFTKNHETVDVDGEENIELSTAIRSYQKCEQHGKKIKFYCKDEDKLCCSTCAISSHKACEGLVEISVIAKERRTQIKGSLIQKQIAELENAMKMSSSHFISENGELTARTTELIAEWNQIRENVNKKFDEFENRLKEEIDALLTTESSENKLNADKCNEIADDMHRLLCILDFTEDNCTKEQQYVVMKKVCCELVLRQSEMGQKFTKLKSVNLSLDVSNMIDGLLNKLTKQAVVTVGSRTRNIPRCAAKTLSLLTDTDLKQENDDEPFYRGLSFLNDDRIVAVDRNNKKCILLDQNLQQIAEKQLAVEPLDIAVTEDDLVVITTGEERKLCFYQIDEHNTINETGIVPVKYNCDSISFVCDKKWVVSTYGSDNIEPAHLLSFDGSFTKPKCDFGGKCFESNKQFKSMYSEEDMTLLITDAERNTVQVYDLQKKEHFEVKDTNIVKPAGIAHYLNDMYFVCSSGTNSIIQLSSQGEILKVDVLNNMKSPSSIYISPNRETLMVSNRRKEEKKLLLFKIQ